MRIVLISAILLTVGCAVRQPTSRNWRFIKQDTAQFLIPPGTTSQLAQTVNRPAEPVDIIPPVRLQVVSPILRDNTAPDDPIAQTTGTGNALTVMVKSSDNLIGFETAWYEARPAPQEAGFTLEPLYAERNIQGATERRPQPETNYFQFQNSAGFYRLFYKTGQTAYTALVIAAPNQIELDRRTEILEAGTASCQKLDNRQCVAIPMRVAINPLLPILVNGKEVMVGWRSNVAAAIRASGERDANAILPNLVIYKTWKGRQVPVEFDRNSPAVLSLILDGGETISWTR